MPPAGRSATSTGERADVRPVERGARDFRCGRLSGRGGARSLRAARAAPPGGGLRGYRVVVCAAESRARLRPCRCVRPEAKFSPNHESPLIQ